VFKQLKEVTENVKFQNIHYLLEDMKEMKLELQA